ncbi:hypothetical protein [Dactylosporangium sp. NPDC048998]|uniref:hypothetical protein n=1 Tax=Dactylosporangium sp. NPDC048998 TaxID=3363976 RepID=UPI00372067AA
MRVLHGVARGLLGFSVFCFLVAVLVVSLGTAAAFVIALAATLTVQVAWRAVTARLASPADLPEEALRHVRADRVRHRRCAGSP